MRGEGDSIGSIVYRCPNCEGTEVRYDYGSKTILCSKCGTSLKDFRPSEVTHSTKRIKITDLKGIPATVTCKDASVPSETFDLLEEMMNRIDPGTFSWDDMNVWVTTHPSLDPYLEVDRTTMPDTRPSMGSITIHAQRPDGKEAHFGIPDFWDTKELHHNPEFWWKDFEGKDGSDKGVKGHRKFDIEKDISIELDFCGKPVRIEFRGRKPKEKVTPKKQRKSG